MPILGAIVLGIQLCFAYHALKTGRPYWWLFVIMGFPVAGCFLYYFIEVFPNTRESVKAQRAVRQIARSFDPDKSLREHVANLEDCGSVDNRIALARSCTDRGMHREAASLYRSCLNGVHAADPDIRFGLAAALLALEDFSEALATAQALRQSHPSFRSPEVAMVMAKALAEYRVLAEEGRWRYAALLARMGRKAERMPEHYREAQHEWLTLARGSLQS